MLPNLPVVMEWVPKLVTGESVYAHVEDASEGELELLNKLGANSIFTIPIIYSNILWGAITLEDHNTYTKFEDENLELIHSIAHLCANAVVRAELEHEIKTRSKMQEALIELSISLSSLEDKPVELIISEGLQKVANVTGINAASIYQFVDHNCDELRLRYLWNGNSNTFFNVQKQPELMEDFPHEFKWLEALRSSNFVLPQSTAGTKWIQLLKDNNTIHRNINNADKDEVTYLDSFHCKTIFLAPVFHQNTLWGTITIEDHEVAREFNQDTLDLLHSIAHLCASAIIRTDMSVELTDQKNLLQTIINAVPQAIFCKDLNNNYTLYNTYFRDCVAASDTDAIGKKSEELLDVSFTELNQKTIEEGKSLVVFPLTLPSGERRIFEITEVPLTREGRIEGIIGVAHDITVYKELEAAALESSHAKSLFLANMSHELRTPLNVVIGLTDLILAENLQNDFISDNIIKINAAGNILLGIVNDVLDISKIESGSLLLCNTEYAVSSLINDVITMAQVRIGERDISFNISIQENFPERLHGDDLRVKQILNNLLSNAIKHTHEGKVELQVQYEEEGQDQIWVTFVIRDSGIGIRKEDIDSIFIDYYQVDNDTNRMYKGTGLGLSITKRFVEMMQGEISVESEFGIGSTFTVRFLQGRVDQYVLSEHTIKNLCNFTYTDERKKTIKKIEYLDLSDKRVLVVDDMKTNLDVTDGLLTKYKIKVDCVMSGMEAIDLIDEHAIHYDAIFMDHMMPVMDGVETADRIRNIPTTYAKQIPIIALTANAIHGIVELFRQHDFQDYISKPIDIHQLDRVLREWVK